jgi:citrate lyase subunit beta/citryl-CoA lyase
VVGNAEKARDLPVWRSLLFVPVNVERFVEKAHTRGADAIQLDLEDSVAPGEKESARRLVQQAAEKVGRGGADVIVRINRPWREAIKDVEASISPIVKGLALPKVASAQHVQLIEEVVAELEAERGVTVGSTRFIAMVETAQALLRVEEIAFSSNRLAAMTLGGEDFALSAGMQPEPEGLFYPKMQMLIAARAAGVVPLGFVGSIAEYNDEDKFRKMIQRSRALGFEGAGCVHPKQVSILNEVHTPAASEVESCRRLIAAYEDALAAGRGAIEFDGKMIDVPIYERAVELVRRDEAIRARRQAA